MSKDVKTYQCACCLDEKLREDYYITKSGKRYMTCKVCKRMQQKLTRRLAALGYSFGRGLFASLERTKVIQMLVEAGILKPNEIPKSLEIKNV